MTVTLIEKPKYNNNLKDFPIGAIGVIRAWGSHTDYIGRVVKRTDKNTLRSLKEVINPANKELWNEYSNLEEMEGNFHIETLQPGTEIKITL